MATVLDDPRKINQFGDAAAPVGFKVVPPTVYAQPANAPARGPAQLLVPPAAGFVTQNPGALPAGTLPVAAAGQQINTSIAQPTTVPAQGPAQVLNPGAAAVPGGNPLDGGAVFGKYPNPNSNLTTRGMQTRLQTGYQVSAPGGAAIVPTEPVPGVAGGMQQPNAPLVGTTPAPYRMNATTDPRSATYGGAPAAAAPVGMTANPTIDPVTGAPARTMDSGNVGTPAAAAATLPGAPATVPAPTDANPADTPEAGGAVTRVGNAYSGTNVSGPITVNGMAPRGGVVGAGGAATDSSYTPPATPLADAAIAANQRLNQAGSAVDSSVDRTRFFENADLRNAAARGSWSPRRGFASDAGAIEAAAIPVRARAAADLAAGNNATTAGVAGMRDAGETARLNTREAGDTARLNIRDAGETARAEQVNAIQQGRLGVEQADQGLRTTAAGFSAATARRLDAAQNELISAKTPEAIRAAQAKVLALQGKDAPNRFTVVPGGQEIDPVSGLARTLPSRVLDNQTGQLVDTGAAAAKPSATPVEGSMSMSNGKPIRFTGGKWVLA